MRRMLWKYHNLTILLLSVLVALFLFRYEPFHEFLLHLGSFGYLGMFLGGVLFVSTFTVATGALVLLLFAEVYSPIEIGIIAGMGAVVGDMTIFRFVRDGLVKELRPTYKWLGGGHLTRVLHTKYFSWTLPVFGAIIIASPLPDEIGVSLMGIAKMKTYTFAIISFLLNALGITSVLLLSSVVKP